MLLRNMLAAALGLALSTAAAMAELQETGLAHAIDAGRRQDFAEMARQLEVLSNQGNAPAKFLLGQAYLDGRGVAVDDRKAVALMQEAAEAGSIGGYFGLGEIYASGFGVQRDDAKALEWLRKAKAAGFPGTDAMIARIEAQAKGPDTVFTCENTGMIGISDPPRPIGVGDLSFMPPSGPKWCIGAGGARAQEIIYYHSIAGRAQRTVSLPDTAHSFYVIVAEADVQGAAPRTPEALLAFANKWAKAGLIFENQAGGKQILRTPLVRLPGRFTMLGWAAQTEHLTHLECVRVDATMEERDNTHFPGLQTMLVADHLCLDPRGGKGLIHISVSERFMKGRRGDLRMMEMPEIDALLATVQIN